MKSASQCAAIIPCHNEAAAIGAIVGATRRYVATILVVDDGSTDATAALARQAGAQVIRHDKRHGKGTALKTGFQWAREQGFHFAITLDGDGQHAPADIPKFFRHAETDVGGIIVGNRMPDAVRMPWLRRWVNRLMSFVLSRMAGQALPDSQCGFRLLDLDIWSSLPTNAKNFECESELLLAFARAGHSIQFVPVEVIYRAERSKIAPVRDTLRWFRWLNQARRTA